MEDLNNYNKYFSRLYSRYKELTKKGIECNIYVSSEAGHYFITEKQLLEELNTDNATSYMLSDAKGQCIFNKEIFKEQEETIEAVRLNWASLQWVEKQTPEICLEAVRRNGRALRFVKEQTPEICLEAVKQTGVALILVKEQTPELCLEAVKQNGTALKFVKEQTHDLCLEAIKQNRFFLHYVENQTPEICLEAIKLDATALEYVNTQSYDLCLEAVKQNGTALKYVENQTEKICLEAVSQNPEAIVYAKKEFKEKASQKVQEKILVENIFHLGKKCFEEKGEFEFPHYGKTMLEFEHKGFVLVNAISGIKKKKDSNEIEAVNYYNFQKDENSIEVAFFKDGTISIEIENWDKNNEKLTKEINPNKIVEQHENSLIKNTPLDEAIQLVTKHNTPSPTATTKIK